MTRGNDRTEAQVAADEAMAKAVQQCIDAYELAERDAVVLDYVTIAMTKNWEQAAKGQSGLAMIYAELDASNTFQTEGLLRAGLRLHLERSDD